MTKYTVEVTVRRLGPQEFEPVAKPSDLPDELPADMADWLDREHGVRPEDHGVDVVPTEDWPPSQAGGN